MKLTVTTTTERTPRPRPLAQLQRDLQGADLRVRALVRKASKPRRNPAYEAGFADICTGYPAALQLPQAPADTYEEFFARGDA
jgi:hypothetical protein